MKRIFNFRSFVLNEKRAQLNIPFDGTDEHGKMHHDHILDAFEDTQVMKPEQYKSSADVDKLIHDAIPHAIKGLEGGTDIDWSNQISSQITTFVYNNLKDSPEYWKPEFFEENDIEIGQEDEDSMFDDDMYSNAAEAMTISDLTEEGKEAWDEFFMEQVNDDVWSMQDTVEDSIKENDGLISVWRAITYTKGSYDDVYDEIIKGHHGGVGIYWSWEADAAEAHWGESNGKLFVLHGQVRPEDVNWSNSIAKTVYDLKEEKELEMNPTAAIKLVGMSTSNENGKDVFVEFDPAYVVKVGSTYRP